jgi:hypothetical protein
LPMAPAAMILLLLARAMRSSLRLP